MNIHLPATCILGFTRGTRVLTHPHIQQDPRYIMKHRPSLPIFGICLGNQILALAAGATTYKMKRRGLERTKQQK